MSRETNEAIAIRGTAERRWREHCLDCSACGMAKERRRPVPLGSRAICRLANGRLRGEG